MTVKHKAKMRFTEYRAEYHLMSPSGGANDLSMMYWNGEYHAFYGLLETYPMGWEKCWGHASSPDLLHWTHHPPCLKQPPRESGKHATWTGFVFENNGIPTAMFTKVHPQEHWLATSRDTITWDMYEGNPVIAAPPPELGKIDVFRDDDVWKEDGVWLLGIGSGLPGKGGAVLLYESDDLINWKYLHPLFVGPTFDTEMFECPDFFKLGDKHVMIVSVNHNKRGCNAYFTGTYENRRFTSENEGFLSVPGSCFYAARTVLAPDGRRILIGWIPYDWGRDFGWIAGWSGAFSIPCEMSVAPDGSVRSEPVKEVEELRAESYDFSGIALEAGQQKILDGPEGRQLEIIMQPNSESEAGIVLCANPEDSILREFTKIGINGKTLIIDRSQSTQFYRENIPGKRKDEFPLPESKGPVELRIFLDNSIIEIFVNNSRFWVGHIFPFMEESRLTGIYAGGGKAKFENLKIWQINPSGCNFGGQF